MQLELLSHPEAAECLCALCFLHPWILNTLPAAVGARSAERASISIILQTLLAVLVPNMPNDLWLWVLWPCSTMLFTVTQVMHWRCGHIEYLRCHWLRLMLVRLAAAAATASNAAALGSLDTLVLPECWLASQGALFWEADSCRADHSFCTISTFNNLRFQLDPTSVTEAPLPGGCNARRTPMTLSMKTAVTSNATVVLGVCRPPPESHRPRLDLRGRGPEDIPHILKATGRSYRPYRYWMQLGDNGDMQPQSWVRL